ncbi:c-type cytochrome [Antarcticibacterium sp. 1MA-6-2]|uniref:c-type cytochrome n=1 Tax=Antarcticibacterium sp. 1MA-6-2 TaxID=2908210 RepID=UPI001F4473F8|nr:c-type cytochrome [Antarcticibacterium sp. 1MA-6-2]UJH89666.1 c-type cytochrome [Antarcticibacterium sp. 1MA-6-2]
MKNFSALVKSVTYMFGAAIALVLVIFLSVLVYQTYPKLFIKESIAETVEVWAPKDIDLALAEGFGDEEVEYGYHLITNSPNLIGPGAEDPNMRFAGNNLACANCHLDSGTRAGSASWVGITERFPQFSNRSNSESTLEDRINGCMERSMDGKELPKRSKEMKAILAYMEWLSEGLPENRKIEYKGFPSIELPDFAVDLVKGSELFKVECAHCHSEDGQGIKNIGTKNGYLYFPLWGEDSYNDGAGMHRVITAAKFIKGNMPFGEATREHPKLTDEEAYHLAGYINSFNRPEKVNKEKDFPDLKLKPMSTPYGPYVDNFSAVQHKYGPFQPIKDFYKENYGLNKSQ